MRFCHLLGVAIPRSAAGSLAEARIYARGALKALGDIFGELSHECLEVTQTAIVAPSRA